MTKNDHKKLIELLNEKSPHTTDDKHLLINLNNAILVESCDIPPDIITLNSLVIFSEMATDKEEKYWLVYPAKADLNQRKVSVLSPIGRSLLGAKIGDQIIVYTPKGEKTLRVEKILHQPEAEGNYE